MMVSRRRKALLKGGGWSDRVRSGLEELIRAGARKNLPVVFDFDNTIVHGDIGEATLAVLVRSGVLNPRRFPPSLCPDFTIPGRGRVRLEDCADITEYYEALLNPTAHGAKDPTPLATGYVWAVEAMAGLRVSDVVAAARAAFDWKSPQYPGFIEVTPGRTVYPVPEFCPEVVELMSVLLRSRFDVWVFSASNVWSVRWVILNRLNPLLRSLGAPPLKPERIIGVSTLLSDNRGLLYKDTVLALEDKAYANLAASRARSLQLTRRLHFPVPTYSGKIAAILDAIGKAPFLGVGDSPGDLPMLSFSRYRLWMARLEKPAYQRAAVATLRAADARTWLVQPLLSTPMPGLLPDVRHLPALQASKMKNVAESLRILQPELGRATRRAAN